MNTIHLGNYEEFFVLYMDNELNANQMKMVDEFLASNPDLRAEFDILMGTKLPLEEFKLEKKELLAESMKASSVNEELLLYIDSELTDDRKKTVEIELTANKDYQIQHQILLQTKLDPSEKIAYPNKKELYHRSEKIISIKVWMRVAAAIVIVAVAGVVYFTNPPRIVDTSGDQSLAGKSIPTQNNEVKEVDPLHPETIATENQPTNVVSAGDEYANRQPAPTEVATTSRRKYGNVPEQKLMAVVTPQEKINESLQPPNETLQRPKVSSVQLEVNNNPDINPSKDILNTGSVTSLNPERKTIKETPEGLGETANRKGSFKGFLRKATRMIEKRTGIDPTNGNGDLLIGAVAINLK